MNLANQNYTKRRGGGKIIPSPVTICTVLYNRHNSTESPTSGAGYVSEPRLTS